jgi:hypothetical protein
MSAARRARQRCGRVRVDGARLNGRRLSSIRGETRLPIAARYVAAECLRQVGPATDRSIRTGSPSPVATPLCWKPLR